MVEAAAAFLRQLLFALAVAFSTNGWYNPDEKAGAGMEFADCHVHMVLDGLDWRKAIDRHRTAPEEGWIRSVLSAYRDGGFSYIRDGGDRWGVGLRAKQLAPEYGMEYRTPLAPLYPAGHYGGFIGTGFHNFGEYVALLDTLRERGGDFVKLMISGLMDFSEFGRLTEPDEPNGELPAWIAAAHDRGFSVMAHCNGAKTALAAAQAGVDSIEHGAYLNLSAMEAMADNGVIWVPTLSTIGNLRGKGRFPEDSVRQILSSAMENVAAYHALGGRIAPGTDAGAWAVPHAGKTEYAYLTHALGSGAEAVLKSGIAAVRERFSGEREHV